MNAKMPRKLAKQRRFFGRKREYNWFIDSIVVLFTFWGRQERQIWERNASVSFDILKQYNCYSALFAYTRDRFLLFALLNSNPKKVSFKRINEIIRDVSMKPGKKKNGQFWHENFTLACLPQFRFMTQKQMGQYLAIHWRRCSFSFLFSLLSSFRLRSIENVHLPEY